MQTKDIKVGDVFRCKERGTIFPYFTVKKIVKGKAQGEKTLRPDGGNNGRTISVSIKLDRLVKDNAKGYQKIENLTVLKQGSDLPKAAPAPEAPVAQPPAPEAPTSATPAPEPGETSVSAPAAPAEAQA